MAVVFLLGPSHWLDVDSPGTPLQIRERIAAAFKQHGHGAFIMEQAADGTDEGLAEKFLRLVQTQGVTQIVVYWPDRAKMPTTLAELVALRFLSTVYPLPEVWILYHENAVDLSTGEFLVRRADGRIAYLRDLRRIRVQALSWRDENHLFEIVQELAVTGFDP